VMTPRAERGTADQLVRLAKAHAYVTKWNNGDYTLRQIADAVSVKFGVWADVEHGRMQFKTPTGWVQILPV